MKCPPIKVSKQFSKNDKVSKVMWYFPLSVIDADFLFFPCPSMSILFISCFLLAILVKMNGESNSFRTIFQVSLWQKVIQITVTFHIEENIGIKNRTTNIASGFCHFVPTKPKENNWKAKIFCNYDFLFLSCTVLIVDVTDDFFKWCTVVGLDFFIFVLLWLTKITKQGQNFWPRLPNLNVLSQTVP